MHFHAPKGFSKGKRPLLHPALVEMLLMASAHSLTKAGVDGPHHLLRHRHQRLIVRVRPIELHHRELRIVPRAHALVSIAATNFVHTFQTSNEQTLEVQLRSNP